MNNPFYGKTQTIAQTKPFFHVDAKKQPAKELRYFEPLFDYSDGDIIVGKEPSEKRSAGTELTIPEGFKIYEAVPSKEEPTSSYWKYKALILFNLSISFFKINYKLNYYVLVTKN